MRTIIVFAGFLTALASAQAVATPAPVATTPACPNDCIVPCVTYQLSNTCLERCGCTQAQADEAVKQAQTPIQPTVAVATPATPAPTQAPASSGFLSFLDPAKQFFGGSTPSANATAAPAAYGQPPANIPQQGFNFSDLSTLLDKFPKQQQQENTLESLVAALATQPLGQYAVTSEPDSKYTIIPIANAAQVVQVNVTKNESTYTVTGSQAQIAVVCSPNSCVGLAFEGGLLKSVRNVSVTSETGPVKMVSVAEAVTAAPPAPVVAVVEPVVTPVISEPVVASPVEVVPVVASTSVVEIVPQPIIDAANQTEALTALFTAMYGNQGGFLEKAGESSSTSWYSAIWIILTLCILGAAYDTFGRSLFQTLSKKRTSFRLASSIGLLRKKSVQESLLSGEQRNEGDYFKFV